MSSGLSSSFVSALQASLSVLLVISYGVIAARLDLLDQPTSKKISTVCVRLFLPALLITSVGSQLELENALQYVAILVWSIIYNVTSLSIGLFSYKVFHLPSWIIPAITFNNTTSLPLLLVESLRATGILERLLRDGEPSSRAITRAQSFFLVNAVVGNYLTFAIGPRLIGVKYKRRVYKDDHAVHPNGSSSRIPTGESDEPDEPDEETPLFLPRVSYADGGIEHGIDAGTKPRWGRVSARIQKLLSLVSALINPPLVGAVIGAVLGLVPALHRAFFADTDAGGIFTAWLTQSLQNVGQLFVSLQVVVVGVSLYSALRKMARGEDSGSISWTSILFVFLVRFAVWPAISVAVIYAVASKTALLDNDPILWFAMMLMPTGPPAIKLVALADVSGADDTVKMILSKLLVISYTLSPVLAFAVVAALNVSEAAITGG
ncbi:hypothetical protein DV736_g2940, partial [Chaetothyriales sp. CBS 134916]